MPSRTVHGIALSALVLGVLSMACDDIVTKTPNSPTTPSMNLMVIVGATALEPGQSIQWFANLNLADGTVKTAGADLITWQSSNTSVATVSPSGVVTSTGVHGEAAISARYRPNTFHNVTRQVVVQPAGTFRLAGTVREEGLAIGVLDARVEVVSSSSFSTTNFNGFYSLFGVPPVADIRVSANGYETRTFSVQLSGNTIQNFVLPLIGGRPSLTGAYTLFIDAVTCPVSSVPPLPADLQHRVYEVDMTQTGTQLRVQLIGGQFRTNHDNKGNNFPGSLQNGGLVRFFLDSYAYYDGGYYGGARLYPSVAERLPDGRFLVTRGQIDLTGAASSGLSGALNFGAMEIWDTAFPSVGSRLQNACRAQTTVRFAPR